MKSVGIVLLAFAPVPGAAFCPAGTAVGPAVGSAKASKGRQQRLQTQKHEGCECGIVLRSAAGDGGDGETTPSFKAWKKFFLEEEMGNPLKATFTKEMHDEPFEWGLNAANQGFDADTADAIAAGVAGAAVAAKSVVEGEGIGVDALAADALAAAGDIAAAAAAAAETVAAPTSTDDSISDSSSDNSSISSDSASPLAAARALLEGRGEGDLEAVDAALALLQPLPDKDADTLTATAEALLAKVRIETEGNTLLFSGLSDSDGNKARWKSGAPPIMKMATDIARKRGFGSEGTSKDGALQQLYTEALMYQLSSKGIVAAVMSGDTNTYKSAVKVLTGKYETQDGGVPWIFSGAYYLAAPWPLRNPRTALERFEKALKARPTSLRNNYYAGLAAFACGRIRPARTYFERAMACGPAESLTERDISPAMRREAEIGHSNCRQKLKD